jgi:hypothetical protein
VENETNEGHNAEITSEHPNPSESKLIADTIQDNVLFRDLTIRELSKIIGKMN